MEQANRFTSLLGSALFVFGLLVLTAQGVYGQVDAGTILGTVKDQTGAVVPGAKVTLTNEGTSFSLSKVTGGDGSYIFTPIKIGTYTVEAEFQGFQKASHPHVTVDVQQQVVVDFNLQPGQLTQTVEVTAAVPLLQTENSSVGQVVGARAVNDLPLNGRNFTFLAQLTAGVNVGQPESRGLNASGSFSANGNRPAQNNYLLDGIDNNIDVVDFLNGTNFVVLPAVDAIQEFKVQTNNYAAEIGRAGGAVLNATIKSGTNQLRGDAWEFVRNDKFDAADFFQNANAPAGQATKGAYRQNQFGFAVGGPVYLPKVYNGRNKSFWFFDYEGTRIRQAVPFTATVPTAAEKASGYTDFSDLLTQGGAPQTDLLGRTFALGAIFDPATTRSVTKGQVDPVTGLTVTDNGFVRDPFPGNKIPANRLNPNAIKLLNLYPSPTSPSLFNNFLPTPGLRDNRNTFDVRIDHNFSEHDQIFGRVSYYDEPQFKPGPFTDIADGGAFNQGNQIATSRNAALSYTHSFSPTMINEARAGFSGLHTGRLQPFGDDLSNIPGQFGIQGIPQVPSNGGLPAFGIGGLNTIGSNAFLVSDEFNSTAQFTENLTKIYHAHTFKGGFEFQHIKFSTLQPPWSRGQFNFDGNYTTIPDKNTGNTGRAQLLLTPIKATVPNGVDFVGGANTVFASNMANTDNGHNYYGGYFQDDWKINPKLTLNLGLRWDHFGYVEENFGAQANFIPAAPGSAQYLIPVERQKDPLSQSFIDTLKKDGIALVYSNNFALGNVQATNFAPRVGFAYQATPKLVVRGAYGIFYGGFENRGYSPNIGENYPFQFSFSFFRPDDSHPISYKNPDGSTCSPAATIETGFSCIPLDPRFVNASGLQLRGIQFDYVTPYTQGYNFTIQYELTPNNSVEIGYVASLARHLETFPGANQVNQILPPSANADKFKPFPDFGRGSSYAATEGNSYYHSLQTKFERRFSNGLNFLGTYTYAKVRTDARDLLNNNIGGFRAPYIPGFGIQGDYGLADFDIRNVFHFSGGYELPIGRGKRFLTNSSGAVNALLGGWSTNWVVVLQDGQPQTIPCTVGTLAGAGCYALLVPGQNPAGGKHNVDQYYNPAAFANPPVARTIGQTDLSPLGGAATQVVGPGFHRMDLSIFKKFRTSERTNLEFRAEFFNLMNHPNFLNPGFGGNGVTPAPGSRDFTNPDTFGKISGTRDNPNDPRQIQFALKFYF